MPQISIELTDPDEARVLFGSNDKNLRQIRRELGIGTVYRDDVLHLTGDADKIQRAQEIIRELRERIVKEGGLHPDDVQQTFRGAGAEPVPEIDIDLLERARRIQPRTVGQASYVDAIRQNDLVFCTGPAGCGKTYLSVAMALNAMRMEQVRKIVLVRPAVEAGERLGFLPGDMLAKVNPFLRPLLDALNDMIDPKQIHLYMQNDVIEIVPLAFMRGRTLNETFMILDEAQNTTVTQMKMFLTRMGEGSRIVVTGDETQNDLPPNTTSGLTDAIRRLSHIQGVACVELTGRDIVRHRLVRDIVKAYDADEQDGQRNGR